MKFMRSGKYKEGAAMNIQIIAIGRLKEKYWTMAVQEYLKRLTPYAKITVTELSEEQAGEGLSQKEKEAVLYKEGGRIIGAFKNGAYNIGLAIGGQRLTSEALSQKISRLAVEGKSDFSFVIGGSFGLAPEVLAKCDMLLSFSDMTFPHQLMRVILLEQVYRAFKIANNEPYHK